MELIENEVHRLRDEGMSERAIADRTGLTRHKVRKTLAEPATSSSNESNERTSTNTYLANMTSALTRSGRISTDSHGKKDTMFSKLAVIMGDETDGEHKYEWMDSDSLRRKSVSELLEIAISSSPEVSRAVWDFHRACVPGWEVNVIDPVTEGTHPEGQEVINAFRRRISRYHGGEEVLYTRMFTSILIRGSVLSEVYFESDAATPVDIAVPDPNTIRFRRVDDAVRGPRWQVGQEQGQDFVPLEADTIRYVALDPLPGKPGSHSPIASAVFPAIFLLGIFQDLRRVIANQGWPRVDVSIDVEGIQDLLVDVLNDENIAENGEAIARVLTAITAQVEDAIGGLKPGDWYVHSSLVKVNDAIGTMNEGSIGEVTSVIESLERVAVKALKTMPLLQGITDGVSEANANRQWEMWAAGIKSIQHLVENSLQSHFDSVLQASGIDAKTQFRFSEIRAAEELRDAQTAMMKLDNAIKYEQAGYMDADEASIYATGHAIPDSLVAERTPLLGEPLIPNDTPEGLFDIDSIDPLVDGNEGGGTGAGADMAQQVYRHQRAGEMLPTVPESVNVTVLDTLAATQEFDDVASEWAGLLNAEIEEDEDAGE